MSNPFSLLLDENDEVIKKEKKNNISTIKVEQPIEQKNLNKINDELIKIINKNISNNYIKITATVQNKTMLCKNIISHGSCKYKHNCKFAHSIEDQIIDKDRKRAYDIITNKNVDNINIHEDNKLLENIIQLTKVCSNCENNKCVGGYNCKNGAINKNCVVCINNLNNICINPSCDKVHLIHTTHNLNMDFFTKLLNTNEQSDISDDEQYKDYINEISDSNDDESIFPN